MTHTLTYIGPDPAVVGVVPLPEGWPAANHDESRPEVLAEKLASGRYRAWRADDGDEPRYNEAQPAPAPAATTAPAAPAEAAPAPAEPVQAQPAGEPAAPPATA